MANPARPMFGDSTPRRNARHSCERSAATGSRCTGIVQLSPLRSRRSRRTRWPCLAMQRNGRVFADAKTLPAASFSTTTRAPVLADGVHRIGAAIECVLAPTDNAPALIEVAILLCTVPLTREIVDGTSDESLGLLSYGEVRAQIVQYTTR